MKRAGIFLLLALILAVPLRGQDNSPKAEVFSGYSFSRASFYTIGHNLNGWGASVSATVTRYFGVTADFSGSYGSQTFALPCPAPGCAPQTTRVSVYHFLGGPRFTRRTHDGTLFVHALLGIVHGNAQVPSSQTEFAMGFGGGADIVLGKRVAYRILQADYISGKRSSNYGGGWENELRIQTGIVFTFGKR